MVYKVVDPIAQGDIWDKWLANFPAATFFHTSYWAAVLIKAYAFTPFYCAWVDNGQILALVPIMEITTFTRKRKGVSLPFSDECSPLVANQYVWKKVFKQIIDMGRKRDWNSIEFRGGSEFMQNETAFAEYAGHSLFINNNIQNIYNNLHYSIKRYIKKAQKNGVSVICDQSISSLKEFYRLHCLTRKRHHLPPQPWSFFASLNDNAIAKGLGYIAIGKTPQGNAIAANIFLSYGSSIIYKYGASDPCFQSTGVSKLTMWEGVRVSVATDKKTLSFGRTDVNQRGLLRYKENFGGKPYPIHYYRYHVNAKQFVKGQNRQTKCKQIIGIVFHWCPIFFLRIVGNIIYKYFG